MKKRERGGASYPCPECGNITHVILTRRRDGKVFRHRECLSCEEVFDTVEDIIEMA